MRVGAITATVPRLVPPSRAGAPISTRSCIAGEAASKAHHHAHLLLAPVHVRGQQFHQPLLGLQRQQHLAQPLPVQLGADQVGHSVHKDRRPGLSAGQRALAAKLLNRSQHLLVGLALHIHAPRHLGPNPLDGHPRKFSFR